MIRVAICDDNMDLANSIEDYISRIGDNLSCDVFLSGVELIKHLESEQISYNIYLMDIEMPMLNGIESADYIRKKDRNALIVFITSHKEYVYKVFEVLPFRFLCKPVQFDAMRVVLEDAIKYIQRENQILFFQIGHEKRQLPYREIVYFEGAGRKVRIHNTSGTVEFYGQISKIVPMLDTNLFAQIHASFIVNMEHIRAIRPEEVEIIGGVKLPVSRKYQLSLKQNHVCFLKQRGGIQ